MLDHPNVVRVFEIGTLSDGRPYVAMELLAGLTIRALLQQRPSLGLARAARLVLQALDGLQAVHDAGLVHRDVKPTNLLVCAHDRLKLLDFGVAKRLRGETGCVLTSTGQVLGTARYMAPEQLRGKPVDGRADQYAAALVFFEAATGVHPFQFAHGSTGSVVARLHRPAPHLSAWCPEPVPAALDAAVARALAVDPNDRFPSASAFADALRAALVLFEHEDRLRVDACATTRIQPVGVTWSGSASGAASQLAPSAAHVPTAPDLTTPDCTPTSVTRPLGSRAAQRLHALGVASSVCALILALTALCVATVTAWTPDGSTALGAAPDCLCTAR